MSSSPQPQKLEATPRAKRLKISIACQFCRSKKIKCDGVRPACGHCQKKDALRGTCTYKGPGLSNTTIHQPLVRPTPPPASSERVDGDGPEGAYCGGVFAGEVKAAIDARLGLPSNERPSLIPMTNAPLFGLVSPHETSSDSVYQVDNVLPPRKQADQLIGLYWQHIQPLEPILDEERFTRSYQALFAGTSLESDERAFLGSLNTVFALSTQLQEHLQPEQRDETSNTYFHRAWGLLRPENIIWEPGSIELVQCLLLMSRYLQSSNNPHLTWMTVGSAMRIAQSLGLHTSDVSSSHTLGRDGRLKRRLWQCCVFVDRAISWALGRTSMVTFTVLPPTISSSLRDESIDSQDSVPHAYYFTKVLQLYEISNHIMLAQMPTWSSFSDSLGLPRLSQDAEYSSIVLQLDACLCKWEKNLPQSLRLDGYQSNADRVSHGQVAMLHLRLFHGRILLFRPMLARCCFISSPVATNAAADLGLEDGFMMNCAALCVKNAQKMIALVLEQYKPDGAAIILSWWHRVFYLHVASTILVGAMLRADLFTESVSQSWTRAMSTLRAHEHLCPFVPQCVANFESLASKISVTCHPGSSGQISPPEGVSNIYFQDVFQDMAFDADNFFFGKEDMAWLNNFELTQ